MDAIVAAHTVAGDADAVVRVRVEGIEALERAIEHLRRDPHVTRTRTMIAPVDARGPSVAKRTRS